ncbi:hypothetical protein SPAN111604_07075 [Sphingomonas antarctica]|uniref:hypothetical protein n=1 Tax=Sphingomonas antarctica TaxID=2040274 RepID=UPI0039EB4F1B
MLALVASPALARPLPAIGWTGTARVFDGNRTIDIVVDTQVEPFGTARSRSWIVGEGPDRARTMVITGTTGTVTFQGKDRTLPDATVRHERMQYALYGLMLTTHARGRCVVARHAGAPDTTLCFDRAGRLQSGSNTVPDSEAGAPLPQTFEFSGELRSHGVIWPQRMLIRHDGKPYFDLKLDMFRASGPGR